MKLIDFLRTCLIVKARHYELALPCHNDGWVIRRGGLSTDYEQEEAWTRY